MALLRNSMVSFSSLGEKNRKRNLSCSTRSIVTFLLVFVVLYVAVLSAVVVDVRRPSSSSTEGTESKTSTNAGITKFQGDFDTASFHGSPFHQPLTIAHEDVSVSMTTNPLTIGVASTVTGCGESPFQDAAAVLKYSLDRHSAAHNNGKYNYQTYIFYHPNATQCVAPLADLGFVLLERPPPVRIEEIRGDDLRERIGNNGCCGEVSEGVCE